MQQAKKFLFFDKDQLPINTSAAAGTDAGPSSAGVARLQAIEMTACAAGHDCLLFGDATGAVAFVTQSGRRLFTLAAHTHRVTALATARAAPGLFVTVGDGPDPRPVPERSRCRAVAAAAARRLALQRTPSKAAAADASGSDSDEETAAVAAV